MRFGNNQKKKNFKLQYNKIRKKIIFCEILHKMREKIENENCYDRHGLK
jgi:hypothetical protein